MFGACSLLARFVRMTGLLVLLAAGCSLVRVETGPGPSVTAALRLTVPGDNGLSARTIQELYRRDLLALYPDSLDDLATRLHTDALTDPAPATLFALAEINYARGRKADRADDPRAALYFFRAAGYAYHFLFDPPAGSKALTSFDPRFRVACDLYNTALARCLVLCQQQDQLDARGKWLLPGREDRDEPVRMEVAHVGFSSAPDEFGLLHLCAAFRVMGLATQHRTFGLGVPLIGERRADSAAPPFVAAESDLAITAFCKFEGGLNHLIESPRARLELINPLAVSSVKVGGQEVPLESDVTTPLAHYLGKAHLERASYRGFFSPATMGTKAGLHFLEPYQPGKVPVILVHGLVSSPVAWAPMLNDLLADPQVRQHFQLGVYFYPSGAPYFTTAADLRSDLDRFRRSVDPQGKDRSLGEMVVLGHSMGGLIARLLTVEGGNDFWRLVSAEPLDKLKLPAPARQELQRTYYFHRQNSVRRVVFLGTPHKGSKISASLLGRLAARIAGMPKPLLDVTQELEKLNPQLHDRIPTSVDLLAPDAPALTLIAHRPRPTGVHYHSVIGVSLNNGLFIEHAFGGDGKAGDGVVPYESAHLDGVDSELVVQANHYRVHQHPMAIREVRRILMEHLEEMQKRLPK
jgi:pimeloyl-ACP methyl ester carboxylesterase